MIISLDVRVNSERKISLVPLQRAVAQWAEHKLCKQKPSSVASISSLNFLCWKMMWNLLAWEPGEQLPVRIDNTDLQAQNDFMNLLPSKKI